ncbi:uncharacterized protein LOC129947890 [Eupeodes corollae]|uniref:uncharacterized protein LOC129947890 n=1 Tax=Eupeodes corollae TaxID=290404 RepID=UPI00249311AD|nr:uncharacterized protein LOC129947890 [Eupeodes corollae]
MAAVDARYRFILVDIGSAWLKNPEHLNLPEDAPLPGTSNKIPFVLIGDEGFALKSTIPRPYPGHKLSVFGIMAHTWRILLKQLEVKTESAINVILVCCILHNLLRMDILESATPRKTTTSAATQVDRDESSVSTSSGYDVRCANYSSSNSI